MYSAAVDPYCYSGTKVLKNFANIRNAKQLRQFELLMTSQRFLEPQPNGRLSVSHYYAIHQHLFQDVYPWAGRPRNVRISKSKSVFCYPEHINSEMKRVFDELRSENYLRNLSPGQFAKNATHFLAELNAIHAFRDGNGRAQLTFIKMIAARAGHPLDLSRLHKTRFLNAIIRSFSGKEDLLAEELLVLVI